MSTFHHGSIKAIATDNPRVHAFEIVGHADDDDVEAMAEHMNEVFDRADGKVDMLLDLSAMTGRDLDAIFDGDVLKAQVRSWTKVGKYAVIGAPTRAAKIIEWADKVIPVEAKAFEADRANEAWAFVSASRISQT
ncbi:STAS/SEC14 domain-containing protein [Roseovarius nanhaiticus]|uniref:STAS/SEC14 domain-containing protein n=1 Tax=Roseovarius nanhaiticus TaxID=573024 RepID=UPI002491339D|nr:STAS/SEC14 domain-containing protein [Roseovarius nanhaiticus]